MNSQETLKRAKDCARQMEAHLSHGRMKEGKREALEGLALCGIQCNFEHQPISITVAGIPVAGNPVASSSVVADLLLTAPLLAPLPTLSNPLLEIALEILPNLALNVLALDLDVTLFTALENTAILLTKQFGRCPHTALIYATYSLLLSQEERFEESNLIAEIVLSDIEHQQDQKQIPAVLNLLASSSLYFKSPGTRCIDLHKRGYEISLKEQDNAKAVLNFNNMLFMYLAQGRALQDIYAHLNVQAFLFKGKELGIVLPGILKSYINALLFANHLPATSLLGSPELMDSPIRIHQAARLHFTHLLAYWQGDLVTALVAGGEIQKYVGQLPTFVYFIEHALFYSLSLLAQAECTGELSQETITLLNNAQDKLRNLAEGYPPNFEAMYYLLTASYKHVLNKPFAAVIEDFRKAIESARINEFTHYEALGNELLGKYYQKIGLAEYAQFHLTAAHTLYRDWGCKLKTQQLQSKFTFLGVSINADSETNFPNAEAVSPSEFGSGSEIAQDQVSIDSILNAAQLLTEKRDREDLLHYLLDVLLTQSAATQVTLTIDDKKGFPSGYLATNQRDSDIEIVNLTKEALIANNTWDLLTYVRTINTPLLIEDIRSFPKNIVAPTELRSRLPLACLPLYDGNSLVGSICIENVSAPNLELIELLDVLNLILNQAAVALENVSHYEKIQIVHNELEQRVQERSLELEAANRELEAFSYAVSHDLRGPLRSIRGFTQALLEDHSQEFDATGNDFLNRIYANSGRMTLLVEGLLELSRVSIKNLNFERVDLSSLAKTIAKNLSLTHPTHFVKFKCSDHFEVIGDERLLYSLMDNLLGNAWKYTTKTEFPAIEFGAYKQAEETIYFVKDNGVGFDMKFKDDLFKSFKRLHSVKQFEGTGIGLATVKRIIDRHNGMIWAESKIDQGSEFYFTLGAIPDNAITR